MARKKRKSTTSGSTVPKPTRGRNLAPLTREKGVFGEKSLLGQWNTSYDLFRKPKENVKKDPVRVKTYVRPVNQKVMTEQKARERVLQRSGFVASRDANPKKFSDHSKIKKTIATGSLGAVKRRDTPRPAEAVATRKPARTARPKATTLKTTNQQRCHSRPTRTKGNGSGRRFAGRYCK